MSVDVGRLLTELNRMTVSELRWRYGEVFGEATRSFNKAHLVKRIAWRTQALQQGDLSERAKRRARELVNDADVRLRPPPQPLLPTNGSTTTTPFRVEADDRLPVPGTLLRRPYKGRTIQVRVLPQGFDYEGEVYRSLSAIARRVTGAHWNGYAFFGLSKPQREPTE